MDISIIHKQKRVAVRQLKDTKEELVDLQENFEREVRAKDLAIIRFSRLLKECEAELRYVQARTEEVIPGLTTGSDSTSSKHHHDDHEDHDDDPHHFVEVTVYQLECDQKYELSCRCCKATA